MKFIQSFLLGIFGAIGALMLEIIALILFAPSAISTESVYGVLNSLNYLFFVVILIEELSKYAFISNPIKRISEERTIVSNSLFFGLGFSVLELFFAYWNFTKGISPDFLGTAGIVIIHASTSAIIAYSIGKQKNNAIFKFFFGLVPAFLVHSAYNISRISEISSQKSANISIMVIALTVAAILLIVSRNSAAKDKI
ncbi:MAG: PrsW family glutamic-type intramembrane protease [Patescibacteria group bacterium]